AFPEDLLKSSVIIVMRRYKQPIRQEDKDFIEEVLKPELEKILVAHNLSTQQIMTPKDPKGGKLLISKDEEAALVVMRLKSEFLEWGNLAIIEKVDRLLDEDLKKLDPVTHQSRVPPGLDLAMSGSAAVGRDMLVASQESASATERWTTILVVLL